MIFGEKCGYYQLLVQVFFPGRNSFIILYSFVKILHQKCFFFRFKSKIVPDLWTYRFIWSSLASPWYYRSKHSIIAVTKISQSAKTWCMYNHIVKGRSQSINCANWIKHFSTELAYHLAYDSWYMSKDNVPLCQQ